MTEHVRETGREPDGVPAFTDDERQTAALLAAGLGRLRTARPGFQERLEGRLLARLDQQEVGPAVQPGPLRRWRLPRRSMLGLAAASALALMASSLSLPLVGAPDVRAREILEKAQANVDNPMLAGVKSYHLTAKVWASRPLPGSERPQEPRESVTEQWYVAPDKMRTETRSAGRDGQTVVSGFMMNGTEARHYSSPDANDVFMMATFAIPVTAGGERPGAGHGRAVTISSQVVEKPTAVASPVPAAGVAKPGIRVPAPHGDGRSQADGVWVASSTRKDGEDTETEAHVVRLDNSCSEPKRTGEGTVAGRAVVVIENDLSSCLPADAPDDLGGRHVRWVDQQTFLPLKMEMYGRSGQLVNRYEVTSIEYDLEIPDRVFSEPPAGMRVRDPMPVPALPKP